MTIPLLYRQELKEYDFGPGHPFRGNRYQVFPDYLQTILSPDRNYFFVSAEKASDTDLELICNPDYIRFTKKYFRDANLGEENDTDFFSYHTMDNHQVGLPGKVEEAARLIVGQAKMAADLVQSGQQKKVVSIGGGMHHAKHASGEGFCIYNDVAFAALYLLENYKLDRVMVIDTDAHAGNGTADYLYTEPRVLFIDLHQDPTTIYPGTGFAGDIGEGEARGKTINLPMSRYAGDDSYRMVFEEIIEPVVKEYKPQIIIRNGGSDPHFRDDLTQLGVTLRGFYMIGQKVARMAEICDGKEIDLIASGYNLQILPHAWMALIAGLAGWKVPIEEPIPPPPSLRIDTRIPDTLKMIAEVKDYLKPYWKCFQ